MQHGSFLCTPRSSQWPVFDDFDAISRLAPGDLAFVKRSTGKWQPAFVVETSAAQMSIKFLVDDKHTKTIPANKWARFIHLAETNR